MSVSNNYMCPVRMSDGRVITDYRPKSTVNFELVEEVGKKNLPKSSYETRMYLQSNASTIMENETKKSFENLMPYKKCKGSEEYNTELPQKYIVSCAFHWVCSNDENKKEKMQQQWKSRNLLYDYFLWKWHRRNTCKTRKKTGKTAHKK